MYGNPTFASVLYLDDTRMPLALDIQVVKNYDQFVTFIQTHGVPDLISFDHDLSIEHYPVFENRPGMHIPYDSYKEKTGLHCARYLIENDLPVKYWNVHSANATGSENIRAEMRKHYPRGEMRLRIPFRCPYE